MNNEELDLLAEEKFSLNLLMTFYVFLKFSVELCRGQKIEYSDVRLIVRLAGQNCSIKEMIFSRDVNSFDENSILY